MRIQPVKKENAGEAEELFSQLEKQHGKVLDIFGVMAHKPEFLESFLGFYKTVWSESDLSAKLKELAYLRTSIQNGCEY